MTEKRYTTQLQAGLGMLEETRVLLDLWEPGMDSGKLLQAALASGRLPNVSARRLRNIVSECFAPRYLAEDTSGARLLKLFLPHASMRELAQLLFLYTCRANLILADFTRDVYWAAYTSGRDTLSRDQAETFVLRANQDGLTQKHWSDSTIFKVSSYLVSSLVDFGLLEAAGRSDRKILPFRIEPRVAAILAYDLHFAGKGDNSVLSDPDWALFGLDRGDVLNELKRLALKGWLIVQAAGDATRIGWRYTNMQELIDGITAG